MELVRLPCWRVMAVRHSRTARCIATSACRTGGIRPVRLHRGMPDRPYLEGRIGNEDMFRACSASSSCLRLESARLARCFFEYRVLLLVGRFGGSWTLSQGHRLLLSSVCGRFAAMYAPLFSRRPFGLARHRAARIFSHRSQTTMSAPR